MGSLNLILVMITLLELLVEATVINEQATPTDCTKGAYHVSISSQPRNTDTQLASSGRAVTHLFDDFTSTGCSGFRKCEAGYYCVNYIRTQCPAGVFGSTIGLQTASCSGQCSKGYFCPVGSTRADQQECGSASVYCPKGSTIPIPVLKGHYTTGVEPSFGDITPKERKTQWAQIECEPGHYCIDGVKRQCPAGTYSNIWGSTSCSAICPEGYYCPIGSIVPIACHSKSFCPKGSDRSHTISKYNYGITTTNSDDMKNSMQALCPIGSYCIPGTDKKQLCPSGRYGSRQGETSSLCTGLCAAGYFCPEGSVRAQQIPCGGSGLYCPEGSSKPIAVSEGYYTYGNGSIISNARCEPYHYNDSTKALKDVGFIITFNIFLT